MMRMMPPAGQGSPSGELIFDGTDLMGLSDREMRAIRGAASAWSSRTR